nr:right-handed parallel beta-helix repeat-containing protein [Candidatus Sigynarchaeota archaeon]
ASISPNTVSFNSFIDIGIGIEFNSLKEYQVLNNSFNYCATSVKVLQASTLNISGNAIDYGTGIELQSATAVYIQHNTMVHLAALGGNGIIVTGTVSTLSIQENLIAHNIETPAGTGMRISNANIGNITITDNNLEYLSVGISIVDVTANLQIEGNTINDTRYGISINGTSNVLIFNNTVNRAVVLGIEVRNDVGKSIISSVIANNTLDAGNSNGVLIKINDMQFENNTVKSFVGYAVILDTITSIRYRRNLLDNPNNLDVRACNGILLEKSTIVSTGYAFMLQNSLVKLYQVTFDAARIRLRDVNSRLSLINFLMVSAIDSISNPVVGATVTINSTWNISNITLITGATGFTQNTTVEYQGFRRGYDNATRSVVVSVKYQAMVFLSNDRIIPMSSDRLESFTATQLFDIEAPAMNEPVFQPEAPLANESVTVSCEITDNVAVDDVFLYYRANYTSWIRISMGYINPLYFAVIPNFGKGTNVQFWIFANDTINNIATRDNLTQLYAYRVKESNALKVIGTIVSPASPLNNQSFIVNTTVYDDSGIQSVSIQLFNPLGGFFDNVNLVNYNATGPGNVSYWGSINPMTSFGGWNITFVIVVYDIFGNNNISTGIGIIFINGTTPPVIGKLETQYAFPSNKENNTISVQVDFTDAGVWVELHYRTFGTSSWTSVLMTYTAANWFEYIMPPFTSGTVIEYYVSATDVSNLTTVLNNNSHYYTFESKKTTPPDISSIVYVPTTPDDENPVNITATVTDNSTLRSVDLLYSIDLGNTWHIIHMNMSQELVPGQQYVYFGSIPAHTYGTKVYFKIEAMDEYNNTFTSPLDSYWIYSYGVNVPLNPAYIYVPTASLVGLSILFFGLFGDQIRVTRRKKRIQKRRNID